MARADHSAVVVLLPCPPWMRGPSELQGKGAAPDCTVRGKGHLTWHPSTSPRNTEKLSGLARPRRGARVRGNPCCPVHLGPVTRHEQVKRNQGLQWAGEGAPWQEAREGLGPGHAGG